MISVKLASYSGVPFDYWIVAWTTGESDIINPAAVYTYPYDTNDALHVQIKLFEHDNPVPVYQSENKGPLIDGKAYIYDVQYGDLLIAGSMPEGDLPDGGIIDPAIINNIFTPVLLVLGVGILSYAVYRTRKK